MSDREWLLPCTFMTLASAAFAVALIPDYSGILPALSLLPAWLFVSAVILSLFGPAGLFSMMKAGVKNPISHLIGRLVSNWRSAVTIGFGVLLAGANMIIFMWVKPLLNYLIPFWADPMLATADYWLFLGHDPAQFLGGLNTVPLAIFYHRGWFALMIITLLLVLSRPSSREKSAMMISYFLLWSVLGPVVHALLPAGGPIFYEQLGYGDRFSSLHLPGEIVKVSTYLWTTYSGEGFGPGAGISAMPSLHIATSAWMIIATAIFAKRWSPLMGALCFLIFLLSISLGWHYAVDGIVGAAGAYACYVFSRYLLEPNARWRRKLALPVGAEIPTP